MSHFYSQILLLAPTEFSVCQPYDEMFVLFKLTLVIMLLMVKHPTPTLYQMAVYFVPRQGHPVAGAVAPTGGEASFPL